MATAGCLYLQYSSKDFFTISLVQVAAAWTAVAVSNYTLQGVSLISSSARSLRLFCLVFLVLSFTLLRFKSRVKYTAMQLLKLLIMLLGSSAFFHVIAVLFGAPVSEQSEETFCWALLMSHLVILPACCLLGARSELLPKIFFSTCPCLNSTIAVLARAVTIGTLSAIVTYRLDATPEAYFQCSIICTLVGAWLGAFPIPLDWDRPWQVWPIPCVIGAILGYIIGLGASAVALALNEKRLRPR